MVENSIVCLLCNHVFEDNEESSMIFDSEILEDFNIQISYSNILSAALEYEINATSAHSIFLCNECKKMVLEYAKIRCKILTAYNRTAQFYNLAPVAIDLNRKLQDIEEDNIAASPKISNQENTFMLDITKEEYVTTTKAYENYNCGAANFVTIFHDGNINFLHTDSENSLPLTNESTNECEHHTSQEEKEEDSYATAEKSIVTNGNDTPIILDSDSETDTENNEAPIQNVKKKVPVCKPFKCDFCEKTFALKKYLEAHNVRKHRDDMDFSIKSSRYNVYQCNYCKRTLSSRDTLKRHMSLHTRKRRSASYKCESCGKKYTSQYNLIYHMESHGQLLECTVCKVHFSNKYNLKTHRKLIHNLSDGDPDQNARYHCNICKIMFVEKAHYNHHKKIHISNNDQSMNFECEVCGKTYSSKYNLIYHMETHSRTFKCTVCNIKFANKYSLRNHIKFLHSNERVLAKVRTLKNN